MSNTRTISTGVVAVITVLAGLFAGAVTATANYYFQRKATEEKAWTTLRTDTYLEFLDKDAAVDRLQTAIKDTSVCDNRKHLTKDAKLERLCDEYAKVQALRIALRYKMAIYGSPKVLDAYTTYLRAANMHYSVQKDKRPTEEIQKTGKRRRDTYASMLREMRAEVFEGVVTPHRDILAIVCPNAGDNCYGFIDPDSAHLAVSK